MPTNPLPKGSCNVSVNVPVEARSVIGWLANSREQYMGEFLRGLIGREVMRAAAEGELSADKARQFLNAMGRASRASLLMVVLFGTLFIAMPRRSPRVARRSPEAAMRIVRVNRKIGEWEAFA
jgi:hypothetical protein